MVSLQNDFCEEMMELYDEIDPKKNINHKLIIQCVNVLIVISPGCFSWVPPYALKIFEYFQLNVYCSIVNSDKIDIGEIRTHAHEVQWISNPPP